MKTGIYCLTSPSGKSYIGQSVNIEKRLSVYRLLFCKGQRKLYNALLKHGFDSFDVKVLEECDRTDLSSREVFWINFLDTVATGYNLKEGGHNGIYSEESKARMSKATKGRKLTEVQRKKMSLARTGKRLSATTRDNMRVASKNMPLETKKAMAELRRERNPKWGIQPSTPGKFKVMFNVDHKTYYKGKFESYESAKLWRDTKISTL